MPTKLSNKSKRAISVPLPGGKKLFLGPGKSGQINTKAVDHPPLAKLIEAGDLEIDEPSRQQGETSSATASPRSGRQTGGGGKSDIRRTSGDR